ncbi:hypothetical protein DFH06DRAFT_1124417 [Mycena polygramma]|nr:hypothetical protein DFH06DRAFT_1124417 [Mycena polygramma]
MKYKLTFLWDNILINDNVLHASYTNKTTKLISCLSTCVFPDKVEYPLDENKIHSGPPHESNFGYAHAKRMVDVQNHAYNEEFGCNFISAIPTNIFDNNYDLEDAHVIPALVHKCYLAKSASPSVRAIPRILTAARTENGTPFITSRSSLSGCCATKTTSSRSSSPLGEDEEMSVKEVADTIVKAVGFEGHYSFDTTKADGQFRKPASNKKLLERVDGFQFTPFEQALDISDKWFVENYDTARTGNNKKA